MSVSLVIGLLVIAHTEALRVAVLPFPELGHLNPLLSVVAKLGSSTTTNIFVPEFFAAECLTFTKAFPRVTCEVFANVSKTKYDDQFFQDLVEKPVLETLGVVNAEVLQLQAKTIAGAFTTAMNGRNFDILLADFAFQVTALAAADVHDLPLAMVWPLVLQFPGVTQVPRLPALASALPLRMTRLQQIGNALLQRLSLLTMWSDASTAHAIRSSVGAPTVPLLDEYIRPAILTPSIFGLDLAQQLCPNVFPVGLLQLPLSGGSLPQDWSDWLSSCQSLVYVNMGSVGQLPPRWIFEFEEALSQVTNDHCVLWKLSKHQQKSLRAFGQRPHQRTVAWLPFSPRVLFERQHVDVFVTHCGDTSVYETVEFGASLVGVPLFADQPDMCQRVQDAGLGLAIPKDDLSAPRLHQAISHMLSSKSNVQEKMRRLRAVSALLGEAQRAVEVLELVATVPQATLSCAHLPSSKRYDWDVTILLAFLLGVFGDAFRWIISRVRSR